MRSLLTIAKSYRRLGRLLLLLALLSWFHVPTLFAQSFAVKTNLLYDATLTPNLGFELPISTKHWTYGLNAGFRPWPTDDQVTRKYRHLMVSPYARLWVDSIYRHSFFSLYAVYSHYNVADVRFPFGLYKAVRDSRRQGDLGAIGLSYGYNWPLSSRWHVEAEAGAALAYTHFEEFACGHCGTKRGTHNKLFVLPKLALNLVYNIGPKPKPVEEEPETIELTPVAPDTLQATGEQVFVFEPRLSVVPDFRGRAGILSAENPVLAHVSEYRPYDRTRIMRKEKGALYVHFPLGKYELNEDFRNNGPVLQRILDITRQIMADTTSSVKRIQIIGLASIEGAVPANEQLAKNRAQVLQRYIQQRIPTPDSLYETTGGGEAWADFRDQLNDLVVADTTASPALIAQLRQAIDSIDSEGDVNVRERKMKRMNGGRTWQYLKQHVLSDQRNSGYLRIYYDYVPDKAAATINRASELLAERRYDEALALLRGVSNDERAQNALGVALWQTGQKEEALRCFRRAAATGNIDARENLRQLEKR